MRTAASSRTFCSTTPPRATPRGAFIRPGGAVAASLERHRSPPLFLPSLPSPHPHPTHLPSPRRPAPRRRLAPLRLTPPSLYKSLQNIRLHLASPPTARRRSYVESYGRLAAWVDGSLDQYRPELTRLLYPIFVHTYLELVAKGASHLADALLHRRARGRLRA